MQMLRRLFSFLVAINPASRLDAYYIRHYPIIWRSRFFLIVSYAVVASSAGYMIGRARRFDHIAQVPTPVDVVFYSWLAFAVTLFLLSPWLHRNLQTQFDRARLRDVILLFFAYLLCFYALSFVPTAYHAGVAKSLTSFPIELRVVEEDRNRVSWFIQSKFRPNNEIDAPYNFNVELLDERSQVNFSREYLGRVQPAFLALKGLYDRYGLSTCVTFATGLPWSTSRDTVQGTACTAADLQRYLADESKAYIEERVYDVRTALGPDDIPVAGFSDFKSRLDLIAVAKRHNSTFSGPYYQPLSIYRILCVLTLAIGMTLHSFRGVRAPSRPLWLSPFFRRVPQPEHQLSASARTQKRFSTPPRRSIAFRHTCRHLLSAWLWIMLSAVMFAGATGFTSFTFGIDSELYTFALNLGLPLLFGLCCVMAHRQFVRAYTVYHIEDLLSFGRSFYLPFLVMTAQIPIIYFAASAIEPYAPTSDFPTDCLFASVIAAIVCLLAQEAVWVEKMVSSPAAVRTPVRGPMRWLASFLYLVALSTVCGFLAVGFVILMGGDAWPLIFLGLIIAVGAVFLVCRKGRFPLLIEKFAFSVLFSSIVISTAIWVLMIADAYNRPGSWEISTSVTILLAFIITYLVMKLVGRFVIQDFFNRWSERIYEPAR